MLRYNLAAFVLVIRPVITAARRWRAARGATQLILEYSLRVTAVKPFDEFSILPTARDTSARFQLLL